MLCRTLVVAPLCPCRPGLPLSCALVQGADISWMSELWREPRVRTLLGSPQCSWLYLHKKIIAPNLPGKSDSSVPPLGGAGLLWRSRWMPLLGLSITATQELRALRLEPRCFWRAAASPWPGDGYEARWLLAWLEDGARTPLTRQVWVGWLKTGTCTEKWQGEGERCVEKAESRPAKSHGDKAFSGVPHAAGSRTQAFMFRSGQFFTLCSQRDLDKVCLED